MQFVDGKWANGNLGVMSPDEANDVQLRLCIAGWSQNGQIVNEVIRQVEGNTAIQPFQYTFDKYYKNVALRMNDNKGYFFDNGGVVVYRIKIIRP